MQHSQSTHEIFHAWTLYQNVIRNNYMRHNEITDKLRSYAQEDLFVLDLGCGDAHTVRQAFQKCKHINYYGVDQSREALAHAEEELGKSDWDTYFFHSDIIDLLPQLSITFDLIIAGYSLHHLSDQEKSSCLAYMQSLTAPNGHCIIYDLLPERDETREVFIKRFLQETEKDWTDMSPGQLTSVREHVQNQDFPIGFEQWQSMAQIAGYKHTKLCYRDPQKHYGFIELS